MATTRERENLTDRRVPTPRDVESLRSLLVHPSRSAVAAELGSSERHLRRLRRSLVDRLDVATTHAAVVVATRAGWIDTASVLDGLGRHRSP